MLADQHEMQLMDLLRRHVVFAVVEPAELQRLVRALEPVPIRLGETVVREGATDDAAFLIFSGKMRVVKDGPAGKPVTLQTLGVGELFGEHALLTGEVRTASVRAAEDGLLFRLARPAFTELLERCPALQRPLEQLARHRSFARFLQFTTALGPVPAAEVVALVERFEANSFREGEIIFREGDKGDRLYLIEEGEVKIIKGDASLEVGLAYLGRGDFFGERGLLQEEPRYAAAVALTATRCASLSRDALTSLQGVAPRVCAGLRRRLEHYAEQEEMARKFGRTRRLPAPPPPVPWETLTDVPSAPPQRRRRGWFAPRFPIVLQEEESDCGAACLAMVAQFHGVSIGLESLRHLAHVGPQGASFAGLTGAAETLGFTWRALVTDFVHLLELPVPAIAHWQGFHYVVIYEVGPNQVVLGDPAQGRLTIARATFEAGWTGNLIQLTPTPKLDVRAGPTLAQRSLRAFVR